MSTFCPALTPCACTGAMRLVRNALDLLGSQWKLGLTAGPRR